MSKITAGAKNLITDIQGLQIGHAVDAGARTGVSVIVPDTPAVIAASISGGGPGTRETDALKPETLVARADAIVLSGGSVYGLDAASGVTSAMGAQGRGFATGAPKPSPIIPAAILFDVANGGDKDWGDTPPYNALGRTAYENLSRDFALGNIGAGFGAGAGGLKGGLGSASSVLDGKVKIGALIAVNPLGSVVDEAGRFWAQSLALEVDGTPEFGLAKLDGQMADATAHPMQGSKIAAALTNTSIGVVATAADLSVAEATRLAIMAQDGLARAIRPVHTPFDGDAIFVLATGAEKLAEADDMRPLALAELGALAADCVSRAVARGVFEAETLGDMQAYRARFED
ncbi:MAG: P1 family peptidase [Alphaproteobacteria bacterium]|nr:P1 family peptidase [Alphaproteobacteria bacterium]